MGWVDSLANGLFAVSSSMQEKRNHHRVQQINEEGRDQRQHDERFRGGAEFVGDGGHVGHGGGGGAQGEAHETGGDHSGVIAPAEQREDQKKIEQQGEHELGDEDQQQGARQIHQGPELNRHQRHGEEGAEGDLGDQIEGGRAGGPAQTKAADLRGQQIAEEDADDQTGNKQR